MAILFDINISPSNNVTIISIWREIVIRTCFFKGTRMINSEDYTTLSTDQPVTVNTYKKSTGQKISGFTSNETTILFHRVKRIVVITENDDVKKITEYTIEVYV